MSVIGFAAWAAACTVSVTKTWEDNMGNEHTTTATSTSPDGNCTTAFNTANRALAKFIAQY